MDNRPIGVFDSGVGGLTVLNEIAKVLPNEDIIYIGDTARVPWETRGKKTIVKFSLQLARFLLKQKVKFIVVACHTSSAIVLPALKKEIKVFSASCPLLVPLVESGLVNHEVTKIMIKEYLSPLLKQKIDTLILACTHYPLLNKAIKKLVGGKVVLFNPGGFIAQELVNELTKKHLLAPKRERRGWVKFYFTDQNYVAVKRFKNFFKICLRDKIKSVNLE